MSRQTVLSVAAMVAATVSLTACGPSGGSPTTPSTATASSEGSQVPSTQSSSGAATPAANASTTTMSGSGYSVTLPEGFGEATPQTTPGGTLSAGDGTRTLVVTAQPAGVLSARQVARRELTALTQQGAKASLGPEVSLGGETGLSVDAARTEGGTRTQLRELVLRHGSRTYEVTMSSSTAGSVDELVAQFTSVLAGWTWTD